MALVQIYGAYLDVFPAYTATRVYAKGAWGDEWEWVPFMVCESLQLNAAPGIDQAVLSRPYQWVLFPEVGAFGWYHTLDLARNGPFVQVREVGPYGEWPLWTGVVTSQSQEVSDGPPMEKVTAHGLEYLLTKVDIGGSTTTAGVIDRTIPFNGVRALGGRATGNRAESARQFGLDGESWTNYDVLLYLIENYTYLGAYQVPFDVVDSTGALAQIVEQHSFDGRSVHSAINQLVDRRRGFTWRLRIGGDNVVYLEVFSQLLFDIELPGFSMPGANYTATIDAEDPYTNVDMTQQFTESYDTVVVAGDPVVVAFTLAYEDGTLEEGWTSTEQNSYIDGVDAEAADAARGAAELAAVFQRHTTPADWDGFVGNGAGAAQNNAFPAADALGALSLETQGVLSYVDKGFLRTLPLEDEKSAGGPNTLYRPAFALCRAGDDNYYYYVDQLTTAETDGQPLSPASFTVEDTGLAIRVAPQGLGHVAALNTWNTEVQVSNTVPEWDYTTLLATVAMEHDTHLFVRAGTWGSGPPGISSRKIIHVPGATAWYIAPGTVLDTDGATLSRHAGGWVRDDSLLLRRIAYHAAIWYGGGRVTQRATLEGVWSGYAIGQVVTTRRFGGSAEFAAAPVTQISVQWRAGRAWTELSTAYDELDWGGMGYV